MHRNMVQRTKLYFIFLAGIMTVSLVILSFKWGTISKIYKITSHETYLCIEHIPATDKHINSSARQLEDQRSSSNESGSTLNRGNIATAKKTKESEIPLGRSSKTIKILKTTNASEIMVVNKKDTSESKTKVLNKVMMESNKPEKSLRVNNSTSETAKGSASIMLKNKQVTTSKEQYYKGISSKVNNIGGDNDTNSQKIKETHPSKIVTKSLSLIHVQNSVVQMEDAQNISNIKSVTKPIIKENNATNIHNQIFSQQTPQPVSASNQRNSLEENKSDPNAQTAGVTSEHEINSLNELDIKEKILTTDTKTSMNGIDSKTEHQPEPRLNTDSQSRQATAVQSIGDKNMNGNGHNIHSKTNTNSNQQPDNSEKTTKSTSVAEMNDDYNSKRKMIEEKLRSIKEQLFNRTTVFDIRKKNVQTESIPNRSVERNQAKTVSGSVNRYLQQRLKYLGLQNRVHPMFNNDNQEYDNNQREGRTARPDACRSCFMLDFKRTINEENTCRGNDLDVLIFISTSPQNKAARDAIRATWGHVCKTEKSKIKCLFVLGNASDDNLNMELTKESNENHDMIQMDFKDSYANLTYKTMTGLQWASEYCSNAKFIMKTDDDMYVNTDLLPILIEQIPQENFLGGFCWGPSPPHRDRTSKWYVSFEMYRGGYFPSMCSGTGYIISSNIIPRLLTASRNIPFFYLEDVYLAICLSKIGLHPTSVSGFNNLFVSYNNCEYKNNLITSHQIEPETLKYYWEDSRLCQETRPKNIKFILKELY